MNEDVSEETKQCIHEYINYLGDVVQRSYIAGMGINLFDSVRGEQVMKCYHRMKLMHKHLEWIHFGVKDDIQ